MGSAFNRIKSIFALEYNKSGKLTYTSFPHWLGAYCSINIQLFANIYSWLLILKSGHEAGNKNCFRHQSKTIHSSNYEAIVSQIRMKF